MRDAVYCSGLVVCRTQKEKNEEPRILKEENSQAHSHARNALPGSGSDVRYNGAYKVDAIDGGSHSINGSQLTLDFGDAQGLCASTYENRRAAIAFGWERKSQLHAGAGLERGA